MAVKWPRFLNRLLRDKVSVTSPPRLMWVHVERRPCVGKPGHEFHEIAQEATREEVEEWLRQQ